MHLVMIRVPSVRNHSTYRAKLTHVLNAWLVLLSRMCFKHRCMINPARFSAATKQVQVSHTTNKAPFKIL